MSKSAPPYMQFYVADYLADTTDLTTAQHGAYLLLLFAAWRNGGRLKNDDSFLAGKAKLPVRVWLKMKMKILAFFTVEGDEIVQGRLADEMMAANEKRARLRANGARGGRPKCLKNIDDEKPNGLQPEPEPEPEPELDSGGGGGGGRASAQPPKIGIENEGAGPDNVIDLQQRLASAFDPVARIRAAVPSLGPLQAAAAPQAWIAAGCDLDLDVIPTIQRLVESADEPIRSWSYFTRAVKCARAQRHEAVAAAAAEDAMPRRSGAARKSQTQRDIEAAKAILEARKAGGAS